jgi:hypothetical protein
MSYAKTAIIMPVLLEERWQVTMTLAAIQTLADTARVDSYDTDLVIVETSTTGPHLHPDDNRALYAQFDRVIYQHNPVKTNVCRNYNEALDLVPPFCAFVVMTSNDIFVRPDWFSALHRVFEVCDDAEVATVAASQLRQPHTPGKHHIKEGVYTPFMMLRNGWRFDEESFPDAWNDTDLIMRVYMQGKRAYRNHASLVHHMGEGRQTMPTAEQEPRQAAARQRFIDKYYKTDTALPDMFRILLEGQII